MALRDQISTIVANAEFDGVNLIDGSVTNIQSLANDSGSTITVTSQLFTLTGLSISSDTLTTVTNSAAARSAVDAAIETANSRLASFGTDAKSLEIHKDFVGQLQDTLNTGIGNLVDADLAKESARLQSLQISSSWVPRRSRSPTRHRSPSWASSRSWSPTGYGVYGLHIPDASLNGVDHVASGA